MPDHNEEIKQLAKEFENCLKILLALGDENRQHLMLEMMRMEHCGSVRLTSLIGRTSCGLFVSKIYLSLSPVYLNTI